MFPFDDVFMTIVLESNAKHKPETYQVKIFSVLPLVWVSINLFQIKHKCWLGKEDENKFN